MTRRTKDPSLPRPVDIIIPVFGAAEVLRACLRSVFSHTYNRPHRVIAVVDGPQDESVSKVLAEQSESGRLIHLQNPERLGFVGSVNRGMSNSANDVILLNSDTRVTAGWVEKLQRAAYSRPRIATVTPLSNSATVCSLPEFLEENFLPNGVSVDAMGEIVEAQSAMDYFEIPTGVGVCLYIRRSSLDTVGLFDETRFGLGYGEENEFCIRANRAGFIHIADDATFIFHAGQMSFGRGKNRRVRKAMRLLKRIDRSYVARVARFIESDSLAPVRDRVTRAITARDEPNRAGIALPRMSILHIVHGWPPHDHGGTEQYASGLAREQATRHQVSVFARIGDLKRATGQRLAYLDSNIRVRFLVNNFDRRNPLSRNAIADRSLERELSSFINQTSPDLVHIHHLAGHCATLMGAIQRAQVPVVYQVQDWWALCARANLWKPGEGLCAGPTPSRCSRCLPLTGLRPRGLLNRLLYVTRRLVFKHQMKAPAAFIMGSEAVRDWYAAAGLFPSDKPVHIVDYGSTGSALSRSQKQSRTTGFPLTFGYIGTLMPHKGVDVAVDAFTDLSPEHAQLRIWGAPLSNSTYASSTRDRADHRVVSFEGPFDELEKEEILASIDILIVPSVGLESYGIVAREAMAAGVPVIASRRGALGEMNIDGLCGASFPPGDKAALRSWLEQLISRPETIDEWRRSLPTISTIDQHSLEIDEIYQSVLEGAR